MRIVRFTHADSDPESAVRCGLLDDRGVVDLALLAPELPRDPAALLALGTRELQALAELVASAPLTAILDPEPLQLHAPVRPGKCLAVGMNYADHAGEFGAEVPAHPTIFTKQVGCIGGPRDPIHLPRVSDALDYEGELVLVIGRRCRHVPVTAALRMVGGYCVGNDVSVRDWQLRTGQFTMGKSFDTHGPIGPWITTADEIGDPQALQIRTLVNDELRQSASTADMIFDCATLVSHLSTAFTLEPGDLIFTGTPSGIGAARTPPAYLHAGDRVRVEIEGLGEIDNAVVPEPDDTVLVPED